MVVALNTKNNGRRKNSVEKIEKAYMELLQICEKKDITISKISEKAGVNRSTYYANFIDIDDLEDRLKEKLLNEFHEIYKEEIKKRSGSNDFLRLFYHIKENQMLYRAYFKLGTLFSVDEMHYDSEQAEKYFNNEYIDYHIEFFYNGINAVIKKWLDGGCKESPEKIEYIIKSEYKGREK